jgi:DNA-binding response OmpR family regulator
MMTKILLVDDEKDILLTVKELLEMEGYEVIMASNGKVGLDKFHELNPDLIITDIMMPIMDGREMIQLIRKDKKNPIIPIIVLSSVISLVGELDQQWDIFLKKPCSINKILDAINKLLK